MEVRNHSRIGAVILAAGMSSRMGEAKQLLRLGEQTLLERVLENVRAAGVNEAVLVLGHAADAIRNSVATGNVKVVVNHAYREGMGSSLRAGISALPAEIDAAFIVLADQPFVRPATLALLMERYRNSSAHIVIPMHRGFRGNPVLLDCSVFPEVMELSGDIGCRAIFGNHLEGIVKLPVEDPGILIDVDSQEDFEKLKEFSQGVTDEKLIRAADLEGREIPGQEGASDQFEVVIVGREPVGIALGKIAKLLNFAVTLVDPLLKVSEAPEADKVLDTLDFSSLPASPSRYVVVASRGKFDEEAVEQALHSNSAYVALVANKKRAQEIQRSLQSSGERPENLKKVRIPAGLEIGAATPEEIALSIMAEIVSLARKKTANTSSAN